MSVVDILKLGTPGALGILLAIASIVWIEPSTSGAMIIITVASVAIAYLLVALCRILLIRSRTSK